MTEHLPTPRPSEQVQRFSLGPVTSGALVVGLGLWLLEHNQSPTEMIWLGVIVIILPWLPLALHYIGALRRWGELPEVKVVDAFGPLLAAAVAEHGMAATLKTVKRALAEMGGRDVDR